MTLEELQQSRSGIDRVEIVSLEGMKYLVRLVCGGQTLLLSDDRGASRLFRSAWQAQDVLAGLTSAPVELIHPCAYGEMIGLDETPMEPMRLPLRSQR